MAEVTVSRLSSPAELLHIYPRQQAPQPCYLSLDTRDGELRADWNAEIGNAVPSEVYHGMVRRYSIPLLLAETANTLMARLLPQAQRVVNGTEIRWDGNNRRAYLADDAHQTEAEIDREIEGYGDEIAWADAADWLYEERDALRARLEAGESEDALMAELDGDGASEDRPVLVGLRNALENLTTA